MKASVKWIEKLHLDGETETGHRIIMDSKPVDEKSEGPTPKELLLQALAGCTMMDVVSILQKQKKELKKFRVDIDGELAKEHPKVFTKINLKYIFSGDGLDEFSVRRAIDLSRDKYCGVSNMLDKTAEITYSIEINNNINN